MKNKCWQLGRHTLVCGDATDESAYVDLVGYGRAALCLTDPPFGAADSDEPCAANTLEFLGVVPADVVVMTFPIDLNVIEIANAMVRYSWAGLRELVWVRWGAGQAHVPVLVLTRRSDAGLQLPRSMTVIDGVRDDTEPVLGCKPRPGRLWDIMIETYSRPGDMVVDPFAGTGTTIWSCERLGRKCAAMEIDRKRCEAIVSAASAYRIPK